MINDHKTQGKWKVYLGNTVTYYKTEGEWKIQLSFKDSDAVCIIHTKSNIAILMYSETDEVIEELFESLLQSY